VPKLDKGLNRGQAGSSFVRFFEKCLGGGEREGGGKGDIEGACLFDGGVSYLFPQQCDGKDCRREDLELVCDLARRSVEVAGRYEQQIVLDHVYQCWHPHLKTQAAYQVVSP
jgi:hypothetical protein